MGQKGRVVAIFGAAVAGLLGLTTIAGAHTGSVGLFHLNHLNTASALTSLANSVAGGVLRVTSNNTSATGGSAVAINAVNNNATSPTVRAVNSAGGTALDLNVTCRVGTACIKAPPMTVNSDTKVVNLNADKLDGMDVSELSPLFARVSADGLSPLAGRGVDRIWKFGGQGLYGVFFNRPIVNCAVLATLNGVLEIGTTISTKTYFGDDPNTPDPDWDESRLVEVFIGNSSGGLDRQFSVAVIC